MPTQFGWANCPAPARAQIEHLLAALNETLGSALRGVYLHGSLAMDCYNPLRSDIDVLAVTDAALSAAQRAALVVALPAISTPEQPIEISILHAGALAPWRHPAPYELHYSEGWRARYAANDGAGEPGLDPDLACHITVARERGVTLFGPPPRELLPEVPPADFLNSILADVLSDEFGLAGLTASANPTYTILNVCRTLGYMNTGRIMSKDEGAMWALIELPWRYGSMTARALEKYRAYGDAPAYTREELAQFCSYALSELRSRARP